MKTYFYCVEDGYGQRTGTYRTIELKDSDIKTNRFGLKVYNGHVLYENQRECLIACLS